MSATLSPFFRQAILEHALMRSNPLGDGLLICLTRRVPDANAAAANLDEPATAHGYSRKTYGYGTGFWQANGYGELVNSQSIEFGPASTRWGTLVGYALLNANASQTLVVGSIVTPLTTDIGQKPVIKAGGLVLSLVD